MCSHRFAAALRVQAGGRLVQEDQRRPVQQAERDLEPPPLPAGQRLDQPLLQPGQLELAGQQLPRAAAPRARRSGTARPGRAVPRAPGSSGRCRPSSGRWPAARSRSSRAPRAGSRSRSAPATVAVPAVGRSSVVSMRSVVVLPAPFGPRKPTISPSPTVRSTPRTASTVRLRLLNVRASPRASIIAIVVPTSVQDQCLAPASPSSSNISIVGFRPRRAKAPGWPPDEKAAPRSPGPCQGAAAGCRRTAGTAPCGRTSRTACSAAAASRPRPGPARSPATAPAPCARWRAGRPRRGSSRSTSPSPRYMSWSSRGTGRASRHSTSA